MFRAGVARQNAEVRLICLVDTVRRQMPTSGHRSKNGVEQVDAEESAVSSTPSSSAALLLRSVYHAARVWNVSPSDARQAQLLYVANEAEPRLAGTIAPGSVISVSPDP